MPTIRVSTKAQFDAALKAAKGGETIVLASGNYGELSTGRDFAKVVTIKSEAPQGAQFDKIALKGATGLRIEGIEVENGIRVEQGSANISIQDADVRGTMYMRASSNLTVENSRIHDGQYGVVLNDVRGFTVRGNDISRSAEDMVRIVGDTSGLLENNFIHDPARKSGHPDCIQLFGATSGSKKTPHDVVIRGNHLYAVADGEGGRYDGAQGIFLSDARTAGGFRNILIEDNLIKVQFANALYIDGGQENVVVRNNTVLPNDGDGGGFIRLAKKSGFDNSGTIVEGNIAKMIIDETKKSEVGDNHVYGRDADLSKLFQGGGDGANWSDFLPVKGSPIDFGSAYGADGLLSKLVKLNGVEIDPVPVRAEQGQAPEGASAASLGEPAPVFEHADLRLTGKGDMVKLAHDARMAVDQGTIELTFNADTVKGKLGLLAKDSTGANAEDLAVFIEDGTLRVRVEDKGDTELLDVKGIKAGRDYDLALTFDEREVQLWLDGKMVDKANIDLDLSQNKQALVIGGLNGMSKAGSTSGASHAFDGAISDFKIYDEVLDHYATAIVPLA